MRAGLRDAYEKKLRERLRFEEMLSDISARLMTAGNDEVDGGVLGALRQIMDFFRVDRCGLMEVLEDRSFVRITHAVYGEGVMRVSDELNLMEMVPWIHNKLMQGEHMCVCRLEDLPEEADIDRRSHVSLGTKSFLTIPLDVGGRISRIITIHSTHRHKQWTEDYIPRLRLLGEILVNALERRKDRLRLEEQLMFEKLLAEISGRFINLPSEQVYAEIEDAQRRICENLGLDLSSLWLWSTETPRKLILTHLYRPLGGPAVPEPMYAHEYFPWCQVKLEAGKTIVVSSLSELPAEAARDKEVWKSFGVKATVTFPLSHGVEPPMGALSFNTMLSERDWPEALVKQLQLVAQTFSNALIHRKMETAMRESEARLSLTTESVGAGLWIMDVETEQVWVSPKGRELFGFEADREIFYENYFSVIHPEDRERVHHEVELSLKTGEGLRCDYRILPPDGAVRWITTCGRLLEKSKGEPQRLMGLSLDITDRKNMENKLQERLQEIEKLKDILEKENLYLREVSKLRLGQEEIVGESKPISKVLVQAAQVATTDSTVLIMGETGTGKELLARAIHYMSCRKDRLLITVNCASLPPALIESELFGRERGAYTGALTRMTGRFEAADNSTLFLDEIGDLPLELQSKLLRVLENGVFERLGSTKNIKVNVRIIAATNRDLSRDVADGKFRKDLFYRLNVFPITIPPLRERKEDIPSLVWAFVRQLEKPLGRRIERISRKSMEALAVYSWPGNIRELKNVIEHAMIMSDSTTLHIQPPSVDPKETVACFNTLKDLERRHIVEVLVKTNWRISGKNSASEILGMKRTTLQSKIKKLGISRTAST